MLSALDTDLLVRAKCTELFHLYPCIFLFISKAFLFKKKKLQIYSIKEYFEKTSFLFFLNKQQTLGKFI